MSATIHPHGALTADQAEQVCADNGLEIAQDGRGHLSLRHVEKLEAARKRFGKPFAHEPGATWAPRATPVLVEWLQSGGANSQVPA